MTPVEQAARRWWLNKRPLAFDAAAHIANPTVNCTSDVEAALALAVVGQVTRARRRKGRT